MENFTADMARDHSSTAPEFLTMTGPAIDLGPDIGRETVGPREPH
jgi:hypothetical protein